MQRMTLAVFSLLISGSVALADPISGYVKADGTPIIPSSLYTVLHPRTSHYTIVFTNPMPPKANCVISIVDTQGAGIYVLHLTESRTQCSFVVHGAVSDIKWDTDFSFMAMPMSN